MDPFATLGIARSFDVDLGLVEKVHRSLSRAVHPDRFAGGTAGERREAMTRAMQVNEAWQIVRDPIRRAETLLVLHGLDVGDEPPPAAEFLMGMLEQRETLAEAASAGDVASLKHLAESVRERADATLRQLATGLTEGADRSLVNKVGELRFYRRFLDEVAAAEDRIV
jgi:molecular chaperone HscB